MMSSQQIGSLASGQAAMFGQFQSYAQQITPSYARNMGNYGNPMVGYSSGPPPVPPPMQAWSPYTPPYMGGIGTMGRQLMSPGASMGSLPSVMGERMLGGGLGALNTGLSVASTAMGVAPLLGMGAGALGMGGLAAGLGALGGPIGIPIAAGLAAGSWGANQMMTGFSQRQETNRVLRNRFGGSYGVGSGSGGRGFSTGEMGEVSTMVREMGANDMFESTESLTKLMDKTASMGLYRGVQSAKQFRQRFQQLTSTLKEIAQTMNTTLEGATEFMSQSRQMGFFSGADISRNLTQTRLGAAASGMTINQMQQIGQMGSQMGMSMGMRGRTGAAAAQNLATDIGVASRAGILRSESLFEATGGLTGAEGIQALTGSIMQANQRFLGRGAGRVLTAAAWDSSTGGINQEVLQRIQRGEISFQEARSMGRRNIASTGGRRSEFFSQEERIRGQLQEQGGMEMGIGMLESHLQRRGRGETFDDPIAQRFLRRQMGYSQSEVEAIQEMRRQMPAIQRERRQAASQELSNMMSGQRRQGSGVEGMRRRWSQMWEREVQNPLRQAADDLQTRISEGIEGLANEFEGRVQMSISSRTKSMVSEWARTGQRPVGMLSDSEARSMTRRAVQVGMQVEGDQPWYTRAARGAGELLGARGPSMGDQLQRARASEHGLSPNASAEEKFAFLNRMQRDLTTSASEMGVSSREMKELGSQAFDSIYNSMSAAQRDSWKANRGNSEKAYQMPKDRIEFLCSKSAALKEYFGKAGGGYKSYAALVNLEESGGFGFLGTDTSAIGAGGGSEYRRLGLTGARSMQEKALERISALSGTAEGKERGGAGWGELTARIGLGIATFGGSEITHGIWGSGVMGRNLWKDVFRDDVSGGGVGSDAAKRLLKNEEIQADLQAARKGDKGALQRLQKASTGSIQTYGINERDQTALGDLVDMVSKGSKAQKESLDSYFRGKSVEQRLLVENAAKEDAAKHRRFSDEYRSTLQKGMGEGALSAYEKIISYQESGDLQKARDAEQVFYEQYGGSKEGSFLLANMRKAGISGGMAEGLATMADYTRLFKGTERNKTKTLLAMTLGQAGVSGQRELSALLSSSFLSRVHAGKISAENLTKELTGRLSETQLQGLADRGMTVDDLARKLQEQVKIGAGGVTADELRKTISGQATDQAWGARLGDAPKEEVGYDAKSMKELQTMNKLMAIMIQKQGYTADTLADAIKNQKNPGGSDE